MASDPAHQSNPSQRQADFTYRMNLDIIKIQDTGKRCHAREELRAEIASLIYDGQVRIADVVLLTTPQKRWLIANPTSPLPSAPPVCVEILSRSNTQAEIDEKRALYFDAGASEVWICNLDGSMSFFSGVDHQLSISLLCPPFPDRIRSA